MRRPAPFGMEGAYWDKDLWDGARSALMEMLLAVRNNVSCAYTEELYHQGQRVPYDEEKEEEPKALRESKDPQ